MQLWGFNFTNLIFYEVVFTSSTNIISTGFLFFTLFFIFFFSFFVVILRQIYKDVLYSTYDKYISFYFIFFISFFLIFFLLECAENQLSAVNILNYNLFNSNFQTSNIVFFVLFLLITPVTLTLLVRNEQFSTFFCVFNFTLLFLIVLFLLNTQNLIGLVMGYELLFIPAFFIMRRTVYSSSAQSAYSVFTVWSVIGSLVVVTGAVYLLVLNNLNALNNLSLLQNKLTDKELFLLSLFFFIGFGVKMPIWPFHYWLTRVHVEASTGFSIFLSGFLVKAAVFVAWKVIAHLGVTTINVFFTAICLFSVLDGVLKLPLQTDLKKLVAFATVFEMGLIYLFIIWKPIQSFVYVYTFCFSHAFLSGLMFFLVEVLYTRAGTRSVDVLSGLAIYFPSVAKIVWIFLFIFWGLPFTLKFFIEFWVLICFFNSNSFILLFFILFILFFSNVFVTKTWLQILYGNPTVKVFQSDLTTWESLVTYYLIFTNTIASVCFTYCVL